MYLQGRRPTRYYASSFKFLKIMVFLHIFMLKNDEQSFSFACVHLFSLEDQEFAGSGAPTGVVEIEVGPIGGRAMCEMVKP